METARLFLLRKSAGSALRLWGKLLIMMVPINIGVEICNRLGVIRFLGDLLAPVMEFVGLPGVIGLVWAITLAANLWAGALLFVSIASFTVLTTGQVTVLGIMMLIAHGLPIELRMAQKCGVRATFSLVLRVGSALLLGFSFNRIFGYFGLLKAPAHILLSVSNDRGGWLSWAQGQIESYIIVLLILLSIVTVLDFLKHYGLMQRLGKTLTPYLSLMGVSQRCAPVTLVGMTLGLVYGGALLLREVESGDVDSEEIVLSIVTINLFHSIIEDTLIVVLLGAALFWVLIVRFLFAVALIRLILIAVRLRRDTVYRLIAYPWAVAGEQVKAGAASVADSPQR